MRNSSNSQDPQNVGAAPCALQGAGFLIAISVLNSFVGAGLARLASRLLITDY